jgi:hypothetical protein
MTRGELIQRYREGPDVLERAVAGFTEAELDHQPSDGGWSPREVIHHTADSEMMSAMRLRRLIAEDSPLIHGYDEAEFARCLYYRERPIAGSLAAVRAAREATASILEHLTEGQWNRAGTHSEGGPYSVDIWLQIYAAHCHDHADQVRRALEEVSPKAS